MALESAVLRNSRCDLEWDCFTGVDCISGDCNLFEEMHPNDSETWRPPNRILKVTIHKVCYPITESVLRQVFGPFGVVEQVNMIGGSDQVLARVVFQSKLEAAEAYGDLHGRNIYDACCQVEIKCGFSQKHDAILDLSRQDTTASLLEVLFPSATPASERLPVDPTASAADVKASTMVACVSGNDVAQPVTVLDSMDCNVDNELPAVSSITDDSVTALNLNDPASFINHSCPRDISTNGSSTCLGHSTSDPVNMNMLGIGTTSTQASLVQVIDYSSPVSIPIVQVPIPKMWFFVSITS